MPSAKDEHDSSYRRNIWNVFKLNNWILGLIGIWPVTIRGIGRHAYKIAIAVCNFTFSFALVPCALHIIYDQKDIIIRLKIGGLLIFGFAAMIKYCILAIRRPKIHRCIEYMKSDWWQVTFKSDRKVMLKFAAISRNLTMIGASFMYTAAHCMCGYIIYSVTSGTYGLAALFATHACGQIEIIVSRLEDLLSGESWKQSSKIHQRIAAIVKDHVRVVRFTIVVEEVLQEVCLVEFISSICTICLLEYACIVDWQQDNKFGLATYSLFLVSFCFNLYILCYIGELLMEKSSHIGYICYMINWYQLSPKSTRSLILIIAIGSHPIKISAGGMVDLSLLTFGSVLKTSMAYLSFLRTLVM